MIVWECVGVDVCVCGCDCVGESGCVGVIAWVKVGVCWCGNLD